MKKTSSTRSVLALILGLSAVAGCATTAGETGGDDTTKTGSAALTGVTGHVTGEGLGKAALGMAGPATLDLAKSVTISALGATGQLTAVAQATLDASGAFAANVPVDAKFLVVQALDGQGKIVGSSILEGVAKAAGQVTIATPISTESSIEAQTLIDVASSLSAQGALDANLAASLRSLINADLAGSIATAISGGADAKAIVHALAEASVIGSHTQALAIANGGAKLDASVFANVEANAAQALNGTLDANVSADVKAEATARFSADVDAAIEAAASGSLSAELTALSHAAANLTFAASLDASLAGIPHAEGIANASLKAAANVEANQMTKAIAEILKGSNAVDGVLDSTAKLSTSLSAATNVGDVVNARAAFESAVAGSVSGGGGSLLANQTGDVQATLAGIVKSSTQLNGQLDGQLKTAVDTVGKLKLDGLAGGSLDQKLQPVVRAFAGFAEGIGQKAPELTSLGATLGEAKAITGLITVVQGGLKNAVPLIRN
jgi:hypothetical protein